MIGRVLYIVILAGASVGVFAQDSAVLLGMLEDVPGVYAGQSNSTKVRVLFARKGSKWTAYQSACENPDCLKRVTTEYPSEVRWFVGMEGREIGEVVARTPSDFGFYAHVGLQDIIGGTPPVIGKSSSEFGGFVGRAVHRPLVTVSKPHFKDPALWKPVEITSQVRKQAVASLRDKGPSVCKEGASDANPLVPFRYGARHLGIRAHRSNSGWKVMTVNVEGAYYCNGGAGDGSLDAQTFAIDPAGKVRFLGAGLTLVDAGDYDDDGHSELVFALSSYNRGGYVLFSDGFAEQVRFVFGHH